MVYQKVNQTMSRGLACSVKEPGCGFIEKGGIVINCTSMCAKSLQFCPTLCDPTDCSPSGSSVQGILQARIMEWAALPSSRGSSDPGIEPASLMSPALADGFFTTSVTWEALSGP